MSTSASTAAWKSRRSIRLAKQAHFAEHFICTCTDWKTPWINDRIYPWRPFIHVPRASQIDAFLRKVLGDDLFNQITVI